MTIEIHLICYTGKSLWLWVPVITNHQSSTDGMGCWQHQHVFYFLYSPSAFRVIKIVSLGTPWTRKILGKSGIFGLRVILVGRQSWSTNLEVVSSYSLLITSPRKKFACFTNKQEGRSAPYEPGLVQGFFPVRGSFFSCPRCLEARNSIKINTNWYKMITFFQSK